jgi:hypothetical protein
MEIVKIVSIDNKEAIGVYSSLEDAVNAACEMRKNGNLNVEVRIYNEETQDELRADAA